MTDDLVARPGDEDLDCHLTGLRLTGVRVHGGDEFMAEATLTFSTMDAGGAFTTWRGDTAVANWPDGREFTVGVGLACSRGDATLVLATLRKWRQRGAFIEMTCAPGKKTMLSSKDACVILPGSEKAAAR